MLWDFIATLLTDISHAVGTEQCLKTLLGEQLKYKAAKIQMKLKCGGEKRLVQE